MSERTRPTAARGRVHVVAIVGPTAVGKTALSLRLAQALGGEIVSADSRQIYRYMDIGTAKATPAERAAVPHHLIDVVPPDERLTLAQYQALATQAIEDIWARGRLPMLVGGTGLYVRALLEGGRSRRCPPSLSCALACRRRPTATAPRRCMPGWPRSTRWRLPGSMRATCAA